jgi:hypothetical protein
MDRRDWGYIFQRSMILSAPVIQTKVQRDAIQPDRESTFVRVKAEERFMHRQKDFLQRVIGLMNVTEQQVRGLVD